MRNSIYTEMRERINEIVNNYKSRPLGGDKTRLRSWEWCHQAFLAKRKQYDKETDETVKAQIVDYLSLHLASFLGSWGMLRSTSFLAQREYKVHYEAVRIIFEKKYRVLWDYQPKNYKKAQKLLFDENNGLYYKLCDAYKKHSDLQKVTNTLITKVLLGTYGCIPGLDINVKKAISKLIDEGVISSHQQTSNPEKLFESLTEFASDHMDILNFKGAEGIVLPPMKCLDLYLWDYGNNIKGDK